MNGPDVLAVLLAKGIPHVFHANSVLTSGAFLRQGGLLSRGYAEANNQPQTPQYTDAIDKRFGIWHDVFVDSDDYHRRIRNPNQYGPVVFEIDSQILNHLPAGSEVFVTRSNPTKWANGQSHGDRYFETSQQLSAALTKGTFDYMITIRTPNGMLPFGQHLIQVVLDDPSKQRADNTDVFASALAALQVMAQQSGVTAPLIKRTCNDGCKCAATYDSHWKHWRSYF
jgi:hypothetical protein